MKLPQLTTVTNAVHNTSTIEYFLDGLKARLFARREVNATKRI